jgi:retron-type reverse transcriptase
MSKRAGSLCAEAFSVSALYQGYYAARIGKRTSRACYLFERRLSAQIDDLHRRLVDGTYTVRPYNTFQIFEPKPRIISAPAFRDRVVQHAIYNQVREVFDKSFIDQSFACRIGMGTHMASDYVQAALKQAPRDSYVLQLDIRRYYYRMDRAVLRKLLERKIKDARLVDVMMMFSDTGEDVGVPIGNLLSQLFGLIYLNPLDHFIKRQLKVRHYARYVDDFVLIGLTREQAVQYRQRIIEFLESELHLELSKSSIHRVTRGINFVGFRTWSTQRFVRKRALYTFRRAANRGKIDSVVSSLGHAGHTASRRYMLNHLLENHRELYRRLPESCRRFHRPSRSGN